MNQNPTNLFVGVCQRLVCEGIDNYKGEAAVSFTITDFN